MNYAESQGQSATRARALADDELHSLKRTYGEAVNETKVFSGSSSKSSVKALEEFATDRMAAN